MLWFSCHRLLKTVITFERVVVDFEKGRRKSSKRSLLEYGRENEKHSRPEFVLLSTSILKTWKIRPE